MLFSLDQRRALVLIARTSPLFAAVAATVACATTLLLLLSSVGVARGQPPYDFVAYRLDDGDEDPDLSRLPRRQLNEAVVSSVLLAIDSPVDLSASFVVGWNVNALWVFAEITDDHVETIAAPLRSLTGPFTCE